MRAYSPKGTMITTSPQRVSVNYSLIDNEFSREPNLGITFEYTGSESDIFWDTAEPTQNASGKFILADSDGGEFPEDHIALLPDDEGHPAIQAIEAGYEIACIGEPGPGKWTFFDLAGKAYSGTHFDTPEAAWFAAGQHLLESADD